MKSPNAPISMKPEDNQQGVDLSGAPAFVTNMSWFPVGHDPAITFDAQSARQAAAELLEENANEQPKCSRFKAKPNMAEGFEQYVPVDINRSACEAISVYLAGEGMKNGSVVPMATVTRNADVIADSGLLATMAASAYANDKSQEWAVAGFRIQQAIFLYDGNWDREKSKDELLEAFQHDKFRNMMTKQQYNPANGVDANESYDRLMACELGSDGGKLRILYAAPTDALDGKGCPMLMRMDSSDEQDEDWFRKALTWYLESRLVASNEICVGELHEGALVGITQTPPECIAIEAEKAKMWHPKVAFSTLYNVLSGLRDALRPLADGQTVMAKFVRDQDFATFERREDLDSMVPISGDFWQVYPQ